MEHRCRYNSIDVPSMRLASGALRAGVAGGGVAVLRSGSVAYDVRAERADPRTLAAIRATTTPQQLGRDIVALLDLVWPVLREQGVRTGHNVVVYHGGTAQELTVDVGVEAFTDFAGRGEIRRTATPSGEVATVAHYGEYSEMAGAYTALERWCQDNARRPAGVNWEVYGDWDDDPARRRTDVYFLLEALAG
jgi:effector-binding domain-containing protein